MTVGQIHSTTMNHPSGITEVLLEKAQRDRDEAQSILKVVEQSHHSALYREGELKRERDHYKQALEEITTSVDDWLNSLIQEPSLDFIHAIKAYAQKKLNETA